MKNFNFNLVCCFVLMTSMHLCMAGSCFANHLTALTADAEVVLEDSIHVRIPTLCADQTQDNFCVPIIVDNVVEVVSFQLELEFDTQILEHTEIRNNHNLIIDSNTLTNSVRFLWFSDLVNEPLDLTLEDNSFLVEVCFDVLDNSVGVTELILDVDFAEFGAHNNGPLAKVPFSLSDGSYSISNGQPSMACFANVDLSLDGTGQAFLDTEFLLAGSDCDFPYTIVEPELVTCDDIGEVIYTVTDTLTSNSCWGTIQLADPLNICSDYDCLDIQITLTDTFPVTLTIEELVVPLPADISELTLNLESVDCGNQGFNPYTVKDSEGIPLCVGTVEVLDPMELCPSTGGGNPLPCIENLDVAIGLTGEVVLTTELVLDGSIPMPNEILITPDRVTCNDLGNDIAYSVFDWLSSRACTGTIRLLDPNNNCESAGSVLDCFPKAIVSLRDTFPTALEIEELLVTVPSNTTTLTISPTDVNCSNLGLSPFRVTDQEGNVCVGTLHVLDQFGICPPVPSNPLPCFDNVNIALDASAEVVLTPELLLSGTAPMPNDFLITPEILTCDDVGNDTDYTILDWVSGRTCSGTISISDPDNVCDPNSLPCFDNIDIALGASGEVMLTPELLFSGPVSTPNEYLNISPNKLTCDDLGNDTDYTIIDWLTSNSCSGTISISDPDNVCPNTDIQCLETIVTLNDTFPLELEIDSLLINGPSDILGFTITPTHLDCNDLGFSSYRIMNENDSILCFGTVQLLDPFGLCDAVLPEPLPCVDIIDIELDPTGEFVLTPELVLNGNVPMPSELFISPQRLTCNDLGSKRYFSVGDGLSDRSCAGRIELSDPSNICDSLGILKCSKVIIQLRDTFPTEIDLELALEIVPSDVSGITIEPPTVDCSNLGLSSFTVMNQAGNSCTQLLQVLDPLNICPNVPSTLVCNDQVNISLDDITGEVSLTPDLLLEGNFPDPNNLIVEPSLLTCDDVLSDVRYTVTDSATDNSCWGTINVEDRTPPVAVGMQNIVISLNSVSGKVFAEQIDNGSFDNCGGITFDPLFFEFDCSDVGLNEVELTVIDNSGNSSTIRTEIRVESAISEEAIDWPDDKISLLAEDNSASADWLNPDELISVYGFREDQVRPSVDCSSVLMNYVDRRLIAAENGTKIIREWTVLDWLSAQFFERTQIISVYVPSLGICDFQPNDFPEGDCQSGHTLDDDVEWPADLVINDHRITPDELIAFSAMEEENVEPQFFGATEYIYSYTDILLELSPENLEINRKWTVYNPLELAHLWVYNQSLSVNLGITERAVIARTISGRPMPGVDMTDGRFTNIIGTAIIEQDDQIHPRYKDHILNGVNIRDAFIIERYITGFDELTPNQMLTGDLNQSSSVNTIDLILLQRAIVGSDTLSYEGHWEFIEESNGSVASEPQQFLGIKPGDIDDSALLLNEEVNLPEEIITFDDRILNAGEVYELPLSITETESGYGVQLSVKFDPNMIEIESVENAANVFSRVLEETTDNTIDFLAHDVFESKDLTDSPIMTIRFRAIANGVLSQAIAMNDERPSYILNDQQNLVLLSEMVDGAITVSVDEVVEQDIVIYPNPASNRLSIDSEYPVLGYSLYNILGNKVKQGNKTVIELSDITEGSYFIMVETSAGKHAEKVLIVK